MKNIFIAIFSIVLLYGCGAANYVVADISLMNDEGKVINKWENAVVETYENNVSTFGGIKPGGGLNFNDANDVSHYIAGGIIHADNIRIIYKSYISHKVEVLSKKYSYLKTIYENDQNSISDIDPNSTLYSITKNRIELVHEAMKDILNQLMKYGYEIN